jgi:hypothetical protein
MLVGATFKRVTPQLTNFQHAKLFRTIVPPRAAEVFTRDTRFESFTVAASMI